jgi:hypothetical protein
VKLYKGVFINEGKHCAHEFITNGINYQHAEAFTLLMFPFLNFKSIKPAIFCIGFNHVDSPNVEQAFGFLLPIAETLILPLTPVPDLLEK